MKHKNKYAKISMLMYCCIFCCLILSGCSSDYKTKGENSIVMIKNSALSTYGSGFAVGIQGKSVDTIVTSYSTVATPNGVLPETAEIQIKDESQRLIANVVYCDIGKNVAILKLKEKTKELQPLFLNNKVDDKETVYVRGYDGTGNIMSNFENFNTTDLVQYNGNINTSDELNSLLIYKFSNEFNKASAGAPAVDRNNNVIGMCAFSTSNMNIYSQYILSSEELIKLLAAQEFDFMTAEEIEYKHIIVLTITFGIILLISTIVFIIMIEKKYKNENNLKFMDKYIKAIDGVLKGNIYKFDGKIAIGRDPLKCDIVFPIDEPGISAMHCSLQLNGNEIYLVDNFSKYGTFLNDGTKINASFPYKIETKRFAFYIAEPKNKFEFVSEKEI